FQADDGIRYATVTGVQTCALPISIRSAAAPPAPVPAMSRPNRRRWCGGRSNRDGNFENAWKPIGRPASDGPMNNSKRSRSPQRRSEERRVGEEVGDGWTPAQSEDT